MVFTSANSSVPQLKGHFASYGVLLAQSFDNTTSWEISMNVLNYPPCSSE
jgi:hypothetical protein